MKGLCGKMTEMLVWQTCSPSTSQLCGKEQLLHSAVNIFFSFFSFSFFLPLKQVSHKGFS